MAHMRIIIRGATLFQQKYKYVRYSTKLAKIFLHTDTGQEEEKPIRYSTSKASSWKASATRTGGEIGDTPWYEPYVISGSLAIFMIYFCILREENDIDEELAKSLYDKIPGLEKKQLEILYEYNEQHKQDNTDVIARLNELQKEEL